MQKNKNNGRFVFGLVLVIVGIVFFADNLYLFQYELSDYLFSWESILVIIGSIMLANSRKNGTGYILITIALISWSADYFDYSFWEVVDDYWPVLLILLGLFIIYKRGDSNKNRCCGDGNSDFSSISDEIKSEMEDSCGKKTVSEPTDDVIDITAIFSAHKALVKSQQFKGGKTTAIFGGVELDLRDANLAQGNYFIDTFTMFGGTEILVPKEWKLSVNVSALFGGVDDKRDGRIRGTHEDGRMLIIKGLTLFGGTEIKYV